MEFQNGAKREHKSHLATEFLKLIAIKIFDS